VDLSAATIETARLILRPTRAEDFDGWAAFMGDEASARYLGGVQPRAEAWRGFLAMAGAWHIQGFAMFSVIERGTGRWIGRVGPWQPEGWPGTEVGWGLIRDAWGHGYASEAASAAIDWAFDRLGWTDVIHVIDPQNAPSIAVAERLGSKLRGRAKLPAPFEHFDVHVWGQSRSQWRSRRALGQA
jgi:RimJ/RimL family protein N-acetyltransferase